MEQKLSGSRWRQIERGWRKDTNTVVQAPAVTLAQMAFSLGISADRLAETGRDDAVEILREMERFTSTPDAPAPDLSLLGELGEYQQQLILKVLDERPRSKREKALLLRTLAEALEAEADDDTPKETSTGRHKGGRGA
ncbi:hypothetical protein ABZU94_10780 [Streptomyces mirabilis]|uniref:hypothetical protein n=1 Tax=Streptomyces sp. NPDC005388 TaxID=3156717 RepID=UPI0033AAA262